MRVTVVAWILLGSFAGDDAAAPPKWILAPPNSPIHQPGDSKLLEVTKDNPHWKTVEAEVLYIEQVRDESPSTNSMDAEPREIQGEAVSKLFPQHRFYVFTFTQRQKPDEPRVMGLLYGLHYSIAVGKDGTVFRLTGITSYRPFIEFLAQEKVKIRNAEEAQLVQDALCETSRRSKGGTAEKLSERQWRLETLYIYAPETREPTHRRPVLINLDETLTVKPPEPYPKPTNE